MLIALGEVMHELLDMEEQREAEHFAGDTFNTAVVLAQLGNNVAYVTAVGEDALSEAFLHNCKQWNVDSRFIQRSAEYQMGAYRIHTETSGERHFSYDRDHSAARYLFRDAEHLRLLLDEMGHPRAVYLSGITLALCSEVSREVLYNWLDKYRLAGGKVYFDGNYRPALWADVRSAREACAKLLSRCDAYLPGLEDEQQLWQEESEQVLVRLSSCGVPEVVIKNGCEPVIVLVDGKRTDVAIATVDSVVDSSGAGDTFNGAWLHARLRGVSGIQAIPFAAKYAAAVIQHRGALLPPSFWQQSDNQGEAIL